MRSSPHGAAQISILQVSGCVVLTRAEKGFPNYTNTVNAVVIQRKRRVPGPGIYYAGGPFLPHDENNGDPLSRVRCLRKPDFSVSDESGEGEKYTLALHYIILLLYFRVCIIGVRIATVGRVVFVIWPRAEAFFEYKRFNFGVDRVAVPLLSSGCFFFSLCFSHFIRRLCLVDLFFWLNSQNYQSPDIA